MSPDELQKPTHVNCTQSQLLQLPCPFWNLALCPLWVSGDSPPKCPHEHISNSGFDMLSLDLNCL